MRFLKRLVVWLLRMLPGGESVVQRLRRLLRPGLQHRPRPGATAEPHAAGIALVVPPGMTLDAAPDLPVVRAGEDPFRLAPFAMFLEPGTPPRREHLQQALLCLAHQPVDFLLISNTLLEPPNLAADRLGNHLIVNARARGLLGGRPEGELQGRVLRLLPAPGDLPISNLADIWPAMQVRGPDLMMPGAAAPGAAAPGAGRPARPPAIVPPSGRPIVFVLPTFLAVGGVERNTVEVMRALGDRYDFVVITSERQAHRQGSLHHQLEGVAAAWYDLMELGENHLHLAFLGTLKAIYRPSLAWLCNGSPWINDNAAALRALFDAAPIIDQQVYDTEIGFIQRTGEPGVQSFDRFIAVNSKIAQVFVERFGMARERIDLIYSAIDASRFDRPPRSEDEKTALAAKWGVPRDRRVFAFIARVTEQKRPLDFLDLARRAVGSGDHFLMVGEGDLTPLVDRALAERPLPNLSRIPFCNDLTELYPLIDGLIVTSSYEGLPIALLETLAAAVPALATDVGDIRLVVEEYGSGKVQDGRIGDQDDLWATFSAWAADLPAYKARAVAAAPSVRARFSAAAIADQYHASWTTAMAARRPSNG